MTGVLSGIAVALGIAVVAGLVLVQARTPIYEVHATQSVRLGDPGHNLVGQSWSGENTGENAGEAEAAEPPA